MSQARIHPTDVRPARTGRTDRGRHGHAATVITGATVALSAVAALWAGGLVLMERSAPLREDDPRPAPSIGLTAPATPAPALPTYAPRAQ